MQQRESCHRYWFPSLFYPRPAVQRTSVIHVFFASWQRFSCYYDTSVLTLFLALKHLLIQALMKNLSVLLTSMNVCRVFSNTCHILFSVGPTRSCWPTREPLLNFCKLTPQKTIHQTHQVTCATRLDIRSEPFDF